MAAEYSGDPVKRLGLFITILLIVGLLLTGAIIHMAASSAGFGDEPAAGAGAAEGR